MPTNALISKKSVMYFAKKFFDLDAKAITKTFKIKMINNTIYTVS